MKCEQVQQALCLPEESMMGRWRSLMANHHVANCQTCTDFQSNLGLIDRGAIGLRTVNFPVELRSHIAARLSTTDSAAGRISRASDASRQNPAGRRALTLTFAAGMIGLLLVANLHNNPANAALKRMQEAVAVVKNARTRLFSKQADGTLHQFEEEWYQQGKWRKEGDYGSRLIVGNTYWHYIVKEHRLVSMRETGVQRSEFSLDALTRGLMRANTHYTSQTLSEEKHGDSILRLVLLEPADEKQRDPNFRNLYWIDERTHLPARLEGQERHGANWAPTWRVEFEFNLQLPKTLFDPQHLSEGVTKVS